MEELARLVHVATKAAGRIDRSTAFREDVEQEVRLKVLVCVPPKLARYAGTGSLFDWLRVVAVRTAFNLKRSDHLQPTAESTLQLLMGAWADGAPTEPALAQELEDILRSTFARLSPTQRLLLRLHFVEGLTTERMAVLYGVHRTTVARWLAEIRQTMFGEARRHFLERHQWETRDLRSLYERLAGNVHITLSRILAAQ